MTKPMKALCAVMGMAVFFSVSRVWAEETAPDAPPALETAAVTDAAPEGPEPEYSFGTVKEVSDQAIIVTEFDYDTNKEKETTYAIDPKVELSNVQSLKEIVVGDEVDIDYFVREGKNVAVVIAVAKPLKDLEGLGD